METENKEEVRFMSAKQMKFLCTLFKTKKFTEEDKETLRAYLVFNKYSVTAASKVISVLKYNSDDVLSFTLKDDEQNCEADVPAPEING